MLEAVDRETAAGTCGMDRQTLRDWVHRYSAEGLAALANRRGAFRPHRPDPVQVSELASWLEVGPDPAADGVARWRRQDLRTRIADRLGIEPHERKVGKHLAALGYRRLSVRPGHPKTDPDAQQAFENTFRDAVANSLPEAVRGKRRRFRLHPDHRPPGPPGPNKPETRLRTIVAREGA